MSAMPAGRPDRRPDWMQRKHAGPDPGEDDIREAAAQLVRDALAAARPMRLSAAVGVTFGTEDEARDEARLLCDRRPARHQHQRVAHRGRRAVQALRRVAQRRAALPARRTRRVRCALPGV